MTVTGPRRTVSVMLMAMLLLAFSSVAALAQATTLTISGLKDHYHTGDEVTLTAVQDPDTGEDHYHWYVREPGDSDFATVPGAFSGTWTFTAHSHMDGAEVQAKLFSHGHDVIAESNVVTIVIDDHGHGDDHDHGHGDDHDHGHGDDHDHGHGDDHDHGHGDDHDHGHGDDHGHSDEDAEGEKTQGEAPAGVPAGLGGAAPSGSALAGSMGWIVLAVTLTLALGAGAARLATRR